MTVKIFGYWACSILLTYCHFVNIENIQHQHGKRNEEVNELNYELLTDVGFDENKINFISRVIYANYKRATTMAGNGVSHQGANLMLDEKAEERLTRLLTKDEYMTFNKIKHKIK